MPKPRRIPAVSFNSLLTRDSDEHPFSFGKYKGETPLAVARKDPSYICWIAETFEPNRIPFTKDLYELCQLMQDDTHTDYHHKEDKDKREELDGILRFK
mgnify:CR=1 FL=1